MAVSIKFSRLNSGEAKEPSGGGSAGACQRLYRLSTGPCHDCRDVRQVGGLISPRRGLRTQVARQEIGAVGLQEQAIRGNGRHEREQVSATTLIADPTGDADGKAQFEIGAHLSAYPGETVGDSPDQGLPMLLENGEEVLVSVPLVQEHRLAYAGGELELAVKRFLLHRA